MVGDSWGGGSNVTGVSFVIDSVWTVGQSGRRSVGTRAGTLAAEVRVVRASGTRSGLRKGTSMLFERNGARPTVEPGASVADSASLVGAVSIGRGCYIDHNVVIESSGPPVTVEDETVIFAGSVLRSVGGDSRPGFSLTVGPRTLVAPQCTLSGCHIGSNCYIATGVIMLQGAVVAEGCRIGVGAIVHAGTKLPELARVGMRHVAVPDGDGFMTTADVERTRDLLATADFFDRAFGTSEADQATLHEAVIAKLLAEAHSWSDTAIR
jgi:carbonic anhydrase/acetyltransferase-like protein (isoleucine patch superfamily)